MSRRRILWVSHFVPYPSTGHGALQRSHHLLRQVAARHDVHLLALAPPTAAAEGLELSEARRELGRIVGGVEFFPLPRDRARLRRAWILGTGAVVPEPFWLRWFDHASLRHRVQALAPAVDLVYFDSILLARLLERSAGRPCVVNHHNIESDVVRQREASTRNPVLRWMLRHESEKVRRLERSMTPRVALNIMVSELDAARLQTLAPGARVATIPNGVDTEYFHAPEGSEGSPCTMAFAGGMDWFPNRDAMLFFVEEIWPRLQEANRQRRALIIGRQPPPELLRRADEALHVLGFVDDVRPHLAQAAIYICPMRLGGGTRLKILDALAMSRALVSTDLGVEGLGLVPEQHYLAANTVDEFCEQIARLEHDAGLRARLGKAGRAHVERHFSWRLVGQQMAELLGTVAATGP